MKITCPSCGHVISDADVGNRASAEALPIYQTIRAAAPGTVFSAKNFSGSRRKQYVYNALWNLERRGVLKKVGYGKFERC